MTPEAREVIVALLRDPEAVPNLRPEQAASIAIEISALLAMVLTRARVEAGAPTGAPGGPATDHLLSPEETAQRLGVSIRWLYRHADSLGFARRLSRKTLRFSERGLDRYLARRQA
jgi:hypothetical protein